MNPKKMPGLAAGQKEERQSIPPFSSNATLPARDLVIAAKAHLPLPALLHSLGLSEHAKKSAKCPFHEDRHNSFSIWRSEAGQWFWKCHAGCGSGDEITLLEKVRGVSNAEALKLFREMAGVALPRSKATSVSPPDWASCVNALSDAHLEQLAEWRGYPGEFVSWLRQQQLVGLYEKHIAFPVHDEAGNVVGVHYRLRDGSWRYYPPGTKVTPLVIGKLMPGDPVHVFESYWDALAFYACGELGALVATRGAGNGALAASFLLATASFLSDDSKVKVYLWTQNDDAGKKWERDICKACAKAAKKLTLKCVKIPSSCKDLNDWTRYGEATVEDLVNAMVSAEPLQHAGLEAEEAIERSSETDDLEGAPTVHSCQGTVGEAERSEGSPNVGVIAPKAPPANPRPLGELLADLKRFLQRWVVFQCPEQADVCALWAMHTWLIKAFDYTPYLWVHAADKRSGKSRLLEVLRLLSCNAVRAQSASPAALIRSVNEESTPTLLLDDLEVDSLRLFLNAGFERGATFLQCAAQGSNLVPFGFPAFCPKALAGIGRGLPDTVQDRSIPIELVRRTREEPVERLRGREARQATARVVAELAALAQQEHLISQLREAQPALPNELEDRQQDVVEPLVAIADMAGGEWPQRARLGLIKLFGQQDDASFGAKLLAAIKAIFDEKDEDRLATRELLKGLVADDDGPWASMFEDDLKHDRLQTASARLARYLKPYKRPDGERIRPRPIRVDDETVKGFYRSDFEDAWSHWLSPCPPGVTGVTSVTSEGKIVTPAVSVTVTGLAGVTDFTREVTPVTAVTPGWERKGTEEL